MDITLDDFTSPDVDQEGTAEALLPAEPVKTGEYIMQINESFVPYIRAPKESTNGTVKYPYLELRWFHTGETKGASVIDRITGSPEAKASGFRLRKLTDMLLALGFSVEEVLGDNCQPKFVRAEIDATTPDGTVPAAIIGGNGEILNIAGRSANVKLKFVEGTEEFPNPKNEITGFALDKETYTAKVAHVKKALGK